MKHESCGDTNYNLCAWYCYKRMDNWTRGLVNKRTIGHHPNDSSIKVGRNTEKSYVDLRRRAVIQKNNNNNNNNDNNNNNNNKITSIDSFPEDW